MGYLVVFLGIMSIVYGFIRFYNSFFPSTYKRSSLLYALGKLYENQDNSGLLLIRGLIGIVFGIGLIIVGLNIENGEVSFGDESNSSEVLSVKSQSDLENAYDLYFYNDLIIFENLSDQDMNLKLKGCGSRFEDELRKYSSVSYSGNIESRNALTLPLENTTEWVSNCIDDRSSTYCDTDADIICGEFEVSTKDFKISSEQLKLDDITQQETL